MAILIDEQRAIFNPDQATAFDAILKSITNNQGHLFFIHAAGGYGKTFLCNTIAAEVRRRDQSIHEDSVARLKCNSYMFLVLPQTKVIIWDKVPMQHKYDIDAVDQCLMS